MKNIIEDSLAAIKKIFEMYSFSLVLLISFFVYLLYFYPQQLIGTFHFIKMLDLKLFFFAGLAGWLSSTAFALPIIIISPINGPSGLLKALSESVKFNYDCATKQNLDNKKTVEFFDLLSLIIWFVFLSLLLSAFNLSKQKDVLMQVFLLESILILIKLYTIRNIAKGISIIKSIKLTLACLLRQFIEFPKVYFIFASFNLLSVFSPIDIFSFLIITTFFYYLPIFKNSIGPTEIFSSLFFGWYLSIGHLLNGFIFSIFLRLNALVFFLLPIIVVKYALKNQSINFYVTT